MAASVLAWDEVIQCQATTWIGMPLFTEHAADPAPRSVAFDDQATERALSKIVRRATAEAKRTSSPARADPTTALRRAPSGRSTASRPGGVGPAFSADWNYRRGRRRGGPAVPGAVAPAWGKLLAASARPPGLGISGTPRDRATRLAAPLTRPPGPDPDRQGPVALRASRHSAMVGMTSRKDGRPATAEPFIRALDSVKTGARARGWTRGAGARGFPNFFLSVGRRNQQRVD